MVKNIQLKISLKFGTSQLKHSVGKHIMVVLVTELFIQDLPYLILHNKFNILSTCPIWGSLIQALSGPLFPQLVTQIPLLYYSF